MSESARPPTAYERFVAATRAILSVSKKEVDAEMRKQGRERKKRRNGKKSKG
jgi:hypothetical protein